ncbi:MAG: Spo0E like sporulation regulatory protein [Pelotomaculum sp. PtaB.Bin104]|nr:MAG: Spo0E like sporulation regulatory protein [Pelotomaculum sp. PtaB.Bin104]
MSCVELITEIEYLRAELQGMAATGAEYAKLLEVSQRLDRLIVEYMRAVA